MLEVSRGTDIKYYYILDIILNIPYGDKTLEKPYSAVSGHGNTIYNPNISNSYFSNLKYTQRFGSYLNNYRKILKS